MADASHLNLLEEDLDENDEQFDRQKRSAGLDSLAERSHVPEKRTSKPDPSISPSNQFHPNNSHDQVEQICGLNKVSEPDSASIFPVDLFNRGNQVNSVTGSCREFLERSWNEFDLIFEGLNRSINEAVEVNDDMDSDNFELGLGFGTEQDANLVLMRDVSSDDFLDDENYSDVGESSMLFVSKFESDSDSGNNFELYHVHDDDGDDDFELGLGFGTEQDANLVLRRDVSSDDFLDDENYSDVGESSMLFVSKFESDSNSGNNFELYHVHDDDDFELAHVLDDDDYDHNIELYHVQNDDDFEVNNINYIDEVEYAYELSQVHQNDDLEMELAHGVDDSFELYHEYSEDEDDPNVNFCFDSLQLEEDDPNIIYNFEWEEDDDDHMIAEGDFSSFISPLNQFVEMNMEELLFDIHRNGVLEHDYHDGYDSNSNDYDAENINLFAQSTENLSRPASKNVIQNLPNGIITQEDVDKNKLVCAVCISEMNVGEIAKQLPCLHKYHGDCIVQWLGIRNTCPVCRYELKTDDD